MNKNQNDNQNQQKDGMSKDRNNPIPNPDKTVPDNPNHDQNHRIGDDEGGDNQKLEEPVMSNENLEDEKVGQNTNLAQNENRVEKETFTKGSL